MQKRLSLMIIVVCMIFSSYTIAFATEPSVDQLLDIILQNTGSTIPSTVSGGDVDTTTTTTSSTSQVTTPVSTTTQLLPTGDDEFKSALFWMYTNGLTQYSTSDAYEPTNSLTREQAAKFFVVMQESIMGTIPTTKNTQCTFADTGFDPTLKAFVDKACAYGILVGSKGIFRPRANISKPEFVTALVRMIQGTKLDETGAIWWLPYYQKARDWGITKELNANAFDIPATRYEAALFLYRSLPWIKKISTTNTLSQPTTGTTTAGSATTSVSTLVPDTALQEAIYWMYDNGMTKYTGIEQFRPFDTLTRQEAAKIFVLFAIQTLGQDVPSAASAGSGCAFDDLSIADQSLVSYIKQACKLQLIKGSKDLFNPEGFLTKPQAVAILIRMLEGPQNETGATWWQSYYDRAVALGMIEASQSDTFDKPISRYEVAKLLYNSKIKHVILKNLNNDFDINKLIYPVPGTVGTGNGTGEITSLISLNNQILQRNDIDTYVIDLLGNQYKIEKQATQKYLNSDYVLYGKILLLDESKSIGTAVFTISNSMIVDGVLRPYDIESYTYYLKPSLQQPYYDMIKKPK